MASLRTKFLSAVSRSGRHPHSRSILPKCPSARNIGHAALISGLVGSAPLDGGCPVTAILESADDDEMDLSHAKSALRVLSCLGDGVAGVPWLTGVAGLGLEIVNLLDVSSHYWK